MWFQKQNLFIFVFRTHKNANRKLNYDTLYWQYIPVTVVMKLVIRAKSREGTGAHTMETMKKLHVVLQVIKPIDSGRQVPF